MPAVAATSTPTGNPLLQSIDGGRYWTGEITYNRVDTPTDVSNFQINLPAPYTTSGVGLTETMWNMLAADLAVLRTYAAFNYSLTDGGDANYFISDFSKPGVPNVTGIASEPGKGPIVGLNRLAWPQFEAQIQDWVVVHELLHTLGLSHPAGLPAALDRSQYTVLSYNWFQLADQAAQEGLPLTPMALDVALLQAKYGATQNNTGDTTYDLTLFGVDRDGSDGRETNGSGYICVWDSAGADTLSFDGGQACLINLNAATLDAGPLSGDLADLIADLSATSRVFAELSATAQAEIVDPVRTAGGFFSSLLAFGSRDPAGYTIANGAVIEAASGGAGGDLLVGNAAANRIAGNAGRDDLYGGSGDDALNGGAGDDLIVGGTGADVAIYLGSRSNYVVSQTLTGWTVVDQRAGAPDGADTVIGVERIRFSNGEVAIGSVNLIDPAVAAGIGNVLREAPSGSNAAGLAADLSFRLAVGATSGSAAIAEIVRTADATTSVATLAYQFFTGGTPSAAGLDYLVSPTGPNPNNLNSAYYQHFNLENRYINFAVNLGKLGEGAASFLQQYGGLDLAQATKQAYGVIFGTAPADAKVAALLGGGRDLYFAYYGGDGLGGIGTKAAMVGWLLAEAEKADIGLYARSNEAFLTDLADGATYSIDLIGVYGRPEYNI